MMMVMMAMKSGGGAKKDEVGWEPTDVAAS